jgi:acetate kinase
MGFTPLEGLVMGTRCGDVDSALITYIMHRDRLAIAAMDAMLNKESGLKGISGIGNDMRSLCEKAKAGNKRARLAIDIFVYRIRKYIGAYIAVMGGVDAIVFTAGIGANQETIRTRVCKGIFDPLKRKPKVLVIPTQEEFMIARQAYKLIKGE